MAFVSDASGTAVTPYDYNRHLEVVANRNSAISRQGREIGWPGLPEDLRLRFDTWGSLKLYCETFFPDTFYLGWSDDHLRVIQRLESAAMGGGLFGFAMPRGSGKTALCRAAITWAIGHGHRRFPVLIGADDSMATAGLVAVKTIIETNEMLAHYFPDMCHAIRALEGIGRRGPGQTMLGDRTRVEWAAHKAVLATLPKGAVDDLLARGCKGWCDAAVLWTAGLASSGVRGVQHITADGVTLRPDFVVLDDPQTDPSARSVPECIKRERILAGAVLGMAGPGKKIAGVMPCTVIRHRDMADRILDRKEHPEWQGERTKMLYGWPENTDLWEQYAAKLQDCWADDSTIEDATAFYVEHQEAMDAGCRAAWLDRYNDDEASAIQHAMNLYYRDQDAFFAEYQNEPREDDLGAAALLSVEDIQERATALPRGVVPLGFDIVTAFVDVQGELLYWLIAAWRDDFTGQVIDYGSFPEQRRRHFSLRDAANTLSVEFPNMSVEGAIRAGLAELVDRFESRRFTREGDGEELRVSHMMIDAGYKTDAIYAFCRAASPSFMVLPSQGVGITAKNKPMREWQTKPGDRVGLNWRVPARDFRKGVRVVSIDVNFWKTFVHEHLAIEAGKVGALTLFGDAKEHRMLAEHLRAEYAVPTQGQGRKLNEWAANPGKPDNHLFDCLVGATVGASIAGAKFAPAERERKNKERRRIKCSELQQRKRQERNNP